MLSLPMVESPVGEPLFIEAVAVYRAAGRAGITARSSVDCLIAACAIRHDLEVLHRDRDFPALARVSNLRHRGDVRVAGRRCARNLLAATRGPVG
jgi:predicted nucleic acid-binding protein